MNEIYIQDRILFFDYLRSNGINLENLNVLEHAHSTIESQSLILVSKYGEQCRQYLVAKCFDSNNKYNVKGIKGNLYMRNCELKINSSQYIFENHLYKTRQLLDIKKDIPKKFDLLLIQGMPHVVMNLYGANINKLFGDVIEESDTNYKSLYEAIFKLISTSSTHDYELCHDKVSELGKELYLIKRRK